MSIICNKWLWYPTTERKNAGPRARVYYQIIDIQEQRQWIREGECGDINPLGVALQLVFTATTHQPRSRVGGLFSFQEKEKLFLLKKAPLHKYNPPNHSWLSNFVIPLLCKYKGLLGRKDISAEKLNSTTECYTAANQWWTNIMWVNKYHVSLLYTCVQQRSCSE